MPLDENVGELGPELARYISAKREELLTDIGYGLQGRMKEGGMSETERAQIMQGYAQILADLDQQQTIMLAEKEKTGRVSMTNVTNLLASLAKVEAAAKTAQGEVMSAQAGAAGKRLDALEDLRTRFGSRTTDDLDDTYTRSIGEVSAFTDRNGKVLTGRAGDFGVKVVEDLRKLSHQDSRLVVPYYEKVLAETGVDLGDFLAGKSAVEGVSNDVVREGYTILQEGVRAHRIAQSKDSELNDQALPFVSAIFRGVGGADGERMASMVMDFRKLVPEGADIGSTTSASASGSPVAPPPADGADFNERGSWVKSVAPGLELHEDGRVYEKADTDGDGVDSMEYRDFALLHSPDSLLKMTTQNKPYLEQTRGVIETEMNRLLNSTDREDLALRDNIIQSEQFKSWASERGYDISQPETARQSLKILMQERRSGLRQAKQKNRMLQDVNAISGAGGDRSPMDVAAASLRHAARSVFRPGELPQGRKSAQITAGAQTPDRTAPDQSEDQGEIAEARSSIAEPREAEGEGGYKYRIHPDNSVELIGGPKSKATPEKPIKLDAATAKKVLAETGNKGGARDRSGALYQHAEAGQEPTEPPSKGEINPSEMGNKARSRLDVLMEQQETDKDPDADPADTPIPEPEEHDITGGLPDTPTTMTKSPDQTRKERRKAALMEEKDQNWENTDLPKWEKEAGIKRGSVSPGLGGRKGDPADGGDESAMLDSFDELGSSMEKTSQQASGIMQQIPGTSARKDPTGGVMEKDPVRRRRYELLRGLV